MKRFVCSQKKNLSYSPVDTSERNLGLKELILVERNNLFLKCKCKFLFLRTDSAVNGIVMNEKD